MSKRFRLSSDSMFERAEEDTPELPSRIVFLSVEGNKTEQYYFKYIETYRNQLGIKSVVHVHPLKRAKNDTLSAPQQVLELLEEYLELRETDSLPERIRPQIPSIYTDDFIMQYLNERESVDEGLKENFEILLKQAGIDIEYKNFLKNYKGEDDQFGIVIDRDCKNHPVLQMENIIKECQKSKYHCYITNPCIEFWLLMHLVDVKDVYEDKMQDFLDNKKVNTNHTFTSKEVSNHAGHSKSIKEEVFRKHYLTNVDFAIQQVERSFTSDIKRLIGSDSRERGELGSNLTKLFELLRE